MSDIDLVVTDLDGTLWDADERIHQRTLHAMANLEDRGVPLLVATGRRPRSAAAGLAKEKLTPPAVLLDGAIGQHFATGEIFHQAPFPPDVAGKVLGAFSQLEVSPCVYVAREDADVVVSSHPSSAPAHLRMIGSWLARGNLERVVQSEPVFAFGVVGGDFQRLGEIHDAIGATAESAVIRDVFFGGATLMVRPPGISKWQGVLSYCQQHDLDPERVLALGDGENDVELLTGAKVAVVVSDGCEAALALADHVVEPASAGGWCAVLDLC